MKEIRFRFSKKQTAFDQAVRNTPVSFFGGARGGGKLLLLDEPIATPDGWKKNGDLAVGDLVIAEDGTPVEIINTTDVCYEPAYRLTFSDGTSIVSGVGHLWKTMTHKDRRLAERRNAEYREKRRKNRPKCGTGKKPYLSTANSLRQYKYLPAPVGDIRTTQDIADTLYVNGETNHSISQPLPMQLLDRELPIAPYSLGAWLGDGTSSSGDITGIDKGVFNRIEADGFVLKPRKKKITANVVGLKAALKSANLLKNKHIPISYLRSSHDQRLGLLQGIMDTDGWCDLDGSCAITLKSKRLFDDVVELLRTFSVIVHVTQCEKICTNSKTKAKGLYHSAKFTTSIPVFGLKRKSKRQNLKPQDRYCNRRFIVLAEPVGVQEMRCIMIANKDGMYLAGKAFIPTHNSFILRNLMLKRRLEYPGTKGVIFRRTYEELESNHIRMLFTEHPWLKKFYKKQERLLVLPNGSTLEFCHCRYLDELDLYQGREWEDIGIDEAGQWPGEWVSRLRASNRTSKPGLAPRMMLTGNPGGVGHQYLKRIFITREYTDREDANDYAFVQAFVQDNPALMKNDPDYIKRLKAEPNEMIRKAWLYGDWDLEAGQFFSELNREIHLVRPFKIPAHWRRFAAFDPGFHHPAAFGWFACNEDGDVYWYRYYCEKGKRIDQVSRELHQWKDTGYLYQVCGGHDCWARGRDGGPTIADQFSGLPPDIRMHLIKANIDRAQGAAELRKRFAWRDMPTGMKGPRLFFFDTPDVRHAFESLTNMVYDPKKPEDVLKQDASDSNKYSGDEAYDVCFVAGTKIQTPTGKRAIETIKVGDLVLTRNGPQPVEAAGTTGVKKTIKVEFSNGAELVGTENHPVFVDGKGFIPLQSLVQGDTVLSCAEKYLPQTSIVKQDRAAKNAVRVLASSPAATESVYNLSVANNPEYYANGILVHNCRYAMMSWPMNSKAVLEERDLTVTETRAARVAEYQKKKRKLNRGRKSYDNTLGRFVH